LLASVSAASIFSGLRGAVNVCSGKSEKGNEKNREYESTEANERMQQSPVRREWERADRREASQYRATLRKSGVIDLISKMHPARSAATFKRWRLAARCDAREKSSAAKTYRGSIRRKDFRNK
jgi:hypothetical protein